MNSYRLTDKSEVTVNLINTQNLNAQTDKPTDSQTGPQAQTNSQNHRQLYGLIL